MRTHLLAMCVALSGLMLHGAQAATYYVDSQIGRDDASGKRMEPQGGEGPLRSLQRVSKLTLVPGDRVLLKCGQTFEGPLHLNTSDRGGEGQLLLGSYGPCAAPNGAGNAPIITGAHVLGAPTASAAGLSRWKVSAPVTQVQFNGQALPAARYPARDYAVWSGTGEESEPGIAIGRWMGNKDISGARLWARTHDWILEERRIQTQVGNLTLDRKLEYPLRQGVGIYLSGKPWMIGAAPAWAYDEDAQMLSARLPAERGTVSVSQDEPLVYVAGPAAVMIQNLHLVDAGADALKINVDAFVQIQGVTIERAARNGISIAGARYVVLEDNLVQDTGTDGIFFAESNKVFIRRNTVLRSGMWGLPKTPQAGINALRTERAVIEENLVDQSAYIGVRFSGDALIRRNIILRSCRLLSDCAAIYTWRRDEFHRPPPTEISLNTVVDVDGDLSVRFVPVNLLIGVYLDNQTRDTTVTGNLIADTALAVNIFGINNRLVNNRLMGTRWKTMTVTYDKDKYKPSDNPGNEVANNDLISAPARPSWPDHVTVPRSGVTLVNLGSRKIAMGWGDWSVVNWSQVAPGCRLLPSNTVRLQGELSQQPTGVVLDCAASKSK